VYSPEGNSGSSVRSRRLDSFRISSHKVSSGTWRSWAYRELPSQNGQIWCSFRYACFATYSVQLAREQDDSQKLWAW
jgi:hypothetical protein